MSKRTSDYEKLRQRWRKMLRKRLPDAYPRGGDNTFVYEDDVLDLMVEQFDEELSARPPMPLMGEARSRLLAHMGVESVDEAIELFGEMKDELTDLRGEVDRYRELERAARAWNEDPGDSRCCVDLSDAIIDIRALDTKR